MSEAVANHAGRAGTETTRDAAPLRRTAVVALLVCAEGDKVLSIVRDMTEAHRAADALRLGEEKLLQSNQQIRALAASLITARETERRHISHQLHPAVLEHLGLVAALESQITEFGHEEQIDLKFDVRMRSEKIPLDLSVCLYRVALEALRNISHHSDASSARVSLTETGESLALEVSDSGRGFDVERAKQGSGLGLISAEERVKLLQGTFEVSSTPGSGTILVARIPLAEAL